MNLIRGSGLGVFKTILLAVIGFFIMPFVVHKLGTVQYGIWAVAGTFIGYYTFFDLGLSGAVFTHLAYAFGKEDHEEARDIYGAGAWIFAVLGLVLLAITFGLALGVRWMHYTHSHTLSTILLIVGIGVAWGFGMRVPFGALNAGQYFHITSGVIILSAILRVIATVVLLETHHGVIALAWLSVYSGIPANALVLWWVHRKFPFLKIFSWPRWNPKVARKLLHFGGTVMVGKIADRVRFQTDTLTVSFFVGLAAVAHYSIGSTLVIYYLDIIGAIIFVLMPVFSMQKSVNDDAGFERSFLSGCRVALSASAFIGFGMIVWSRDFVIRWMGPSFVDVYPVIVILSLAVFLETAQSTSVNALYATLHERAYATLNICEAAANLILSLLLVRRFGMVGVAYGTLIPSIVFRGIVQPIVVEKLLHVSMRKTAEVYLRTGARCATFLVLPWVIAHYFLAPDYPHLIFVGALSAVVYALPMWWLEFDCIGADRVLAKARAARRVLLAR